MGLQCHQDAMCEVAMGCMHFQRHLNKNDDLVHAGRSARFQPLDRHDSGRTSKSQSPLLPGFRVLPD